jgi:hypothetical protein
MDRRWHGGLRTLASCGLVAIVGVLVSAGVAASQSAPSGACVIFFEGNRCSPGFERSSCCTEAGPYMRGCWTNDEARSMEVHGPAGTTISVFDSPKASTSDDYFVITKSDDEPVCVGSFEGARATLGETSNEWFYSGGNGLDGKVSTFTWSDPRESSGSSDVRSEESPARASRGRSGRPR